MSEQWSYTTDQDVAALNAELDRAWDELKRSGELERRAKKAGIPGHALSSASRANAIDIQEASAGMDPVIGAIIIAVSGGAGTLAASAVKRVIEDIWKDIMLPRLKQRFGVGAVSERPSDSEGK